MTFVRRTASFADFGIEADWQLVDLVTGVNGAILGDIILTHPRLELVGGQRWV